MSQDLINQITLNCLMNKHQYEKYVTNKISKSINEEDKKNYMERILSLTKELITNSESEVEEENTIAPDVKYTFEQYIKSCIQYFKLTDNNDVIQEKYKELDIKLVEELKEDVQEEEEELEKENKEEKEEKEQDNSLWVRSIKMCNPSLDSFITMNMNSMKKHQD